MPAILKKAYSSNGETGDTIYSQASTDLPLQASRVKRRPPRSRVAIVAEHIKTRYPRCFWCSLGKRMRRIGQQWNFVKEPLDGRRNWEEISDDTCLFLEGRVGSLGSVFFVRLFYVFQRHRGKGGSVQGVRGAKAGAEMEMLHVRL